MRELETNNECAMPRFPAWTSIPIVLTLAQEQLDREMSPTTTIIFPSTLILPDYRTPWRPSRKSSYVACSCDLYFYIGATIAVRILRSPAGSCRVLSCYRIIATDFLTRNPFIPRCYRYCMAGFGFVSMTSPSLSLLCLSTQPTCRWQPSWCKYWERYKWCWMASTFSRIPPSWAVQCHIILDRRPTHIILPQLLPGPRSLMYVLQSLISL